MTTLYIIFIVVCVIAECFDFINTTNIFKKVGILIILTGIFGEIFHQKTELIAIGTMLYICADLWRKRKFLNRIKNGNFK